MTDPITERHIDPSVGEDDDNGTMPENIATLEAAVVGHRIVTAEPLPEEYPMKRLTLETAREGIGQGVVYQPPGYPEGREVGVITSVGDRVVFVRYGADRGSKATSPNDLVWEMSTP